MNGDCTTARIEHAAPDLHLRRSGAEQPSEREAAEFDEQHEPRRHDADFGE